MKVLKAYPPNIAQIQKVLNPPFATVFTYGDTIYNPNVDAELPPDLVAHERVHMFQQMKFLTPGEWWDKYLKDENFRFNQEVEAYKAQWKIMRHSRMANWLLHGIVTDLSGDMYGNLVSYTIARRLIKS
jgi:hypothetical protein